MGEELSVNEVEGEDKMRLGVQGYFFETKIPSYGGTGTPELYRKFQMRAGVQKVGNTVIETERIEIEEVYEMVKRGTCLS